MNRVLAIVCVLTISTLSGQASAQTRWYVGPNVGYGGYGGYGFGGGTTPASAAGHAMADMTRSQGMYNVMTSAAMVNVEQARGEYIQNQKQWTEVYMMKQRVVQAEQAKRLEEARARNAKIAEQQAEHPSSLPPRLNSSELDPATGKIAWPSALMRDTFASQRKEIEGLFETRAHTGSTSELTEAIYKKVRGMQDELRKHIRDLVTQEYMESRKFLDRLSLEGRFPVG
ncbi:MAG: hypothetical protein U0941_12250 [Planctomycetaceae bacterium]